MEATEIKNMSHAQLVERVQALESELVKCSTSDEDATPYHDAARLWLEFEKDMNYMRGYRGTYDELFEEIVKDLALLGRIQQDVTLAHMVRNSTCDFVPASNAGRGLDDEQYSKLFFFLDRLSSALYHLKDLYKQLSRDEPKT